MLLRTSDSRAGICKHLQGREGDNDTRWCLDLRTRLTASGGKRRTGRCIAVTRIVSHMRDGSIKVGRDGGCLDQIRAPILSDRWR